MPDLHSLDGTVVTGVPPELALYPFGVFTTFVVHDGAVLDLTAHVSRLARDARALWDHALDEARLRALVGQHAARLDAPVSMRVTLYPEHLSMASPAAASGCRVLVSSRAVALPVAAEADLTVGTAEFVRESAELKSTGLFSQIRLRRDAQLAGYDDVLFRRGDEALEGATWSLVVWRDDEVVTPWLDVLTSITASQLGRVAGDLGLPFRRRPVTVAELGSARLVLAANANSPARAIRAVDGDAVPVDADLLAAVAQRYSALEREPVLLEP